MPVLIIQLCRPAEGTKHHCPQHQPYEPLASLDSDFLPSGGKLRCHVSPERIQWTGSHPNCGESTQAVHTAQGFEGVFSLRHQGAGCCVVSTGRAVARPCRADERRRWGLCGNIFSSSTFFFLLLFLISCSSHFYRVLSFFVALVSKIKWNNRLLLFPHSSCSSCYCSSPCSCSFLLQLFLQLTSQQRDRKQFCLESHGLEVSVFTLPDAYCVAQS